MKYLVLDSVEAELVNKAEGQKRLKDSLENEDMGFLVLDKDGQTIGWISKGKYQIVPIETHRDIFSAYYVQIKGMCKYFREHLDKTGVSKAEYERTAKTYSLLKLVYQHVFRILNINLMNT